jgi:uncharacterized protein YcbK (DUF882 family)
MGYKAFSAIACNPRLSRRRFLTTCAGASLGLVAAPVLADIPSVSERQLAFHNTHTGESLRCTYWADGQYLADALTEINQLLRDHRSGEIYPIAPALLDLVYRVNHAVGGRNPFEIVSGYRSPGTNAELRRKNAGVAKHSLHMSGKAMDIRLPGCELKELQRAALALRAGGVGYYPTSGFIHVDVGRVRRW